VLNAKEGQLRPKQLDQPTTCEFQNFRDRTLGICSKPSYCKNCSLMGEKFNYGKRGIFWYLIKITCERSLDLPKQVFLT
jgi:hypothetical protein